MNMCVVFVIYSFNIPSRPAAFPDLNARIAGVISFSIIGTLSISLLSMSLNPICSESKVSVFEEELVPLK